jgi:transposase
MEYFAGLDISMEETHICILDREGLLSREGIASSTPKAIATFLADGPVCAKVVFETGRMAPMLFHGLTELGVPVVCIESSKAYQALK